MLIISYFFQKDNRNTNLIIKILPKRISKKKDQFEKLGKNLHSMRSLYKLVFVSHYLEIVSFESAFLVHAVCSRIFLREQIGLLFSVAIMKVKMQNIASPIEMEMWCATLRYGSINYCSTFIFEQNAKFT